MLKFLLVAAFLVIATPAFKSVKEMKPLTEEHAMEHHHFHRSHRRDEKRVVVDNPDHAEVLRRVHHAKSGEGHRVQSPHPKHHVGPLYSDDVIPTHKPKPRFDNQGNPIPHEITDASHHSLRHK
jgi:hypothetical protein